MEISMLGFLHENKVEVLSELPPATTAYVFQQRKKEYKNVGLTIEIPSNTSDWLVLKIIKTDGSFWVGKFEPGVEGNSGVYATPSESFLCVVVKGQGYWVSIYNPEQYTVLPSFPIKKVIPIPQRDIMIFVDFVRLTAYGRDGFMWQTPSLSYDGLKIDRILSDTLEGTGWDAPNNQEVKFRVNISNGEFTGGSSPDWVL